MNKRDARDKFVLGAVTVTLAAGTVYLFEFHSDANFGIWASFVATIVSAFHWLTVYDDKRLDAGGDDHVGPA